MALELRESSFLPSRREEAEEPDVDFDQLFREFAPRLKRLASGQFRDPHVAEDVVQETFLRAYRSRLRFDPSRPVWPWLRSIASNVCLDMFAKESPAKQSLDRDGNVDPELLLDHRTDPIADCISAERRRTIREVMASLNERHRRVLLLKDSEGWSREDIAAFEGIGLEALKSVLKRARETFRDRYAALAEKRGLSVITWPLIGPVVRRMRTLRNRLYAERVDAVTPAFLVSQAALAKLVTTTVAMIVLAAAFGSSNAQVQRGASAGSSPSVDTAGRLSLNKTEKPTNDAVPARSIDASVKANDLAPDGPKATVGVSADVRRGEKASLNNKLWARVGEEEGSALEGRAAWVYCDTEVRKAACDAIDAVPPRPLT